MIWARILIPKSSIAVPTAGILAVAPAKRIVSFSLTVASAVFSLIAFLLAGSTPRAPLYHFRSPYTYTVESDLADIDQPNVSRNVNASFLGIMMFNWVTPVIRLGHQKEQMGLDDLPHLSSSFRTITLFRNFRRSAKESEKTFEEKQGFTLDSDLGSHRDGLGYAPKMFNRLLWRLLAVNKLAFALNCSLAFVTAFLYYLPAFFLRKVVGFLEVANQVKGREKTLGYAYCFGLLVSLVLDTIMTGQLWYISNCMLASRIRIQLNSVIFAKTLKVCPLDDVL